MTAATPRAAVCGSRHALAGGMGCGDLGVACPSCRAPKGHDCAPVADPSEIAEPFPPSPGAP